MHNLGVGKPLFDDAFHPLPIETVFLTPSAERLEPEPTDKEAKGLQGLTVAGDTIVITVPSHNDPQPSTHHRDRQVHASP